MLYFDFCFLYVIDINEINLLLLCRLKLHLLLFFDFLDHLELLLLLLINFSVDFSQLLAKSSSGPIEIVVVIQCHLVLAMLFVGVQVGIQVACYCLAYVHIIVQLLMLLKDPAAILVLFMVNHAAA